MKPKEVIRVVRTRRGHCYPRRFVQRYDVTQLEEELRQFTALFSLEEDFDFEITIRIKKRQHEA